jgi:myo-inositol-1(or 4)-monophosphatase
VTKEEEMAFIAPFALQSKRLMRTIAPALDWCLLASGWIDYIVMQKSDIMDVAAGILIAREAGAKITDWSGEGYRHKPFTIPCLASLIATGGPLHETILTMTAVGSRSG